MIVKLTNCGDNTHRYDIPTDDWFDSMAYINTKNYSKTGKSMDKEIIPKYLWI